MIKRFSFGFIIFAASLILMPSVAILAANESVGPQKTEQVANGKKHGGHHGSKHYKHGSKYHHRDNWRYQSGRWYYYNPYYYDPYYYDPYYYQDEPDNGIIFRFRL